MEMVLDCLIVNAPEHPVKHKTGAMQCLPFPNMRPSSPLPVSPAWF
jgi:hypothetical protein